jgi:hypothetical protein
MNQPSAELSFFFMEGLRLATYEKLAVFCAFPTDAVVPTKLAVSIVPLFCSIVLKSSLVRLRLNPHGR